MREKHYKCLVIPIGFEGLCGKKMGHLGPVREKCYKGFVIPIGHGGLCGNRAGHQEPVREIRGIMSYDWTGTKEERSLCENSMKKSQGYSR